MPRAYRLVALTAAAVLAGGIVVAVTAPGASPAEPRTRARADAAAIVPATTRQTVTTQPTHSPTPTPSPTRTRTAAKPLFPLPARPAYPQPCPPPPIPPGPPFKAPKPSVPAAALPSVVPIAPHRQVDIAAVSGKGMWLTTWPDTRVNVLCRIKRIGHIQRTRRSGH